MPTTDITSADDALVRAGIPAPVDADDLPPTEYLVMEVLAARQRLGETHWTFPSRCGPALAALQRKDLVAVKSGIVPGTRRAWLTDLGRTLFLDADYTPPARR